MTDLAWLCISKQRVRELIDPHYYPRILLLMKRQPYLKIPVPGYYIRYNGVSNLFQAAVKPLDDSPLPAWPEERR